MPRKKVRLTASQELQDRVLFHYNANLNDEEMVKALEVEGFAIPIRHLSRLRQKLGLRRRSRYPAFCEYSDGEEDDQERESRAQAAAATPAAKKRKTDAADGALIPKVTAYVENYMSQYDASHDMDHIRRVVGLAHAIYNETRQERPDGTLQDGGAPLDLQVITLAALLHDAHDEKYVQPGQDVTTLILSTLLNYGAPEALAIKVQRIVLGVSYQAETRDPGQVARLIARYPELAVVQDADRLDALGAVGVGRAFAYGAAKTTQSLTGTLGHFDEKLLRLEGLMKTAAGRRMARQRSDRLRVFKEWWAEERRESEGFLRKR